MAIHPMQYLVDVDFFIRSAPEDLGQLFAIKVVAGPTERVLRCIRQIRQLTESV